MRLAGPPLCRRRLLAALAAAALPGRNAAATQARAAPAAAAASAVAPATGDADRAAAAPAPARHPGFVARGPLRWLQLGDVGGLAAFDAVASTAGASAAGLWLFDSGAEATVVDTALAAQLGLRARGTRRVRGPGGRLDSVPAVEPPLLQAGGAGVPLHDAAVLDLSAHAAAAGEPVLGIVGWPTLGAARWRLDLGSLLWEAGTVTPPAAGVATLPLSPDHALPVVSALWGDRAPMPLLLDTGFAGGLMLWGDAAQALGAAAGSSARIDVAGIGGRTTVSAVLLARLRVAAAEWHDVPVMLLPGSPMRDVASLRGVVGVIGMALFADAVLGHDPAARRAWTTAGIGAAPLPGGFGVVLAAADGRLVAQQVLAGSPAAAAGVRAGDLLLALDGTPLPQPTPAAAWGRLRGVAEAVFEWQRGNASRTTRLRRERFFARVS